MRATDGLLHPVATIERIAYLVDAELPHVVDQPPDVTLRPIIVHDADPGLDRAGRCESSCRRTAPSLIAHRCADSLRLEPTAGAPSAALRGEGAGLSEPGSDIEPSEGMLRGNSTLARVLEAKQNTGG